MGTKMVSEMVGVDEKSSVKRGHGRQQEDVILSRSVGLIAYAGGVGVLLPNRVAFQSNVAR